MLFKNPILKDAVIARRVRARALARSKRIEFASLFPPKTCFQVDNGNGLATTGSRIDRTWPKNGQNTLVQRSSSPFTHRMFSTWLVVPTSSRHLAVAGSCHPLDVTWTSVHAFPANCRESTPMETSGNDSRRNEPIDRRGFEQGGYVSIFNEDWKGFGWSIGDRTGQG